MNKELLISIKPEHLVNILNGQKRRLKSKEKRLVIGNINENKELENE